MNSKLRFALLFNFFVAAILLCSCITIYILYKDYRAEDFKQRLINEANDLHSEFDIVASSDSIPLNFISQLYTNNLNYQYVALVNANYNIVYKQPKDSIIPYLKDTTIYNKIKEKKLYTFTIDTREAVGLYYEESNAYVIASAIDNVGLRKLKNLSYILITVFCGALILSTVIAFLFVQQAFKPLVKLSSQIEDTTAQNLTRQVDEGSSNDEIAMIARNFNAMLKRLNNTFENQKTFVQNASHELRTPLATMLSQTEAALNRNLDITGYKKVLVSLKEDQTDLIELTNSLLLISQYEKLSYSVNWPAMRIDELLYDTVATCKRMFPDIHINLDFKTLPENETELMISGNDSLLKSAFRNLIKNAYSYSDNRAVSLLIEIEKPFVTVIFSNTGSQLSQPEIDKIKMPFFRGQNAATKKGYGLGLSIVTRIIGMHRGNLDYKAVNGNENQFIIVLPMA